MHFKFTRASAHSATTIVVLLGGLILGIPIAQRIQVAGDRADSQESPLSQFPVPSRTNDNNNRIMAFGLVSDLDGIAVAYTSEADGLVAPDGSWSHTLSAEQMAKVLRLDAVVSDTILFRAQEGWLTADAKVISRRIRDEREAQGKPRDFVYPEWITRDYAFTRERLMHPTADDERVLDTISRAARAVPPEPGDGIRAVGVSRGELERGAVVLSAGMLPLEP
jgi:hypothetical protein